MKGASQGQRPQLSKGHGISHSAAARQQGGPCREEGTRREAGPSPFNPLRLVASLECYLALKGGLHARV